MKYQFITLILLINLFAACKENNPVQVFISGSEGHKSYRIPAVISLPDGALLVFAEGRVNGSNDFGDINIVVKRSSDNGKSWSALMTAVDYDSLQAGNPAPVADLTDPDYPDGRVFLFYNTGNNHENEVRKGNGYREVWFITSVDEGLTWSDPVNITSQVHRLKKPEVDTAYNFSEDWRSYANAPGHAMQISEGRYKGRIVVPANHSAGDPKENWEDYASHVFYSDDHGRSFKLGESVSIPGSNEATVAEISGDRLLLNARNQKGDIKARIVAISSDGGSHWDKVFFDGILIDPVCQGSILNAGKSKEGFILAFSNAADTINRNNLTLRFSCDDGMTWNQALTIDKSDDPDNMKDFTAYSDLVTLPHRRIGILYERKDYSEIVFRVIKPVINCD